MEKSETNNRIDELNNSSWEKRRNEIDVSHNLAQEAYHLSLKHDYKKGIA
ncbi:MAG: hypothetical protein AAGF85_03785 [Bacteroidota bacterium]